MCGLHIFHDETITSGAFIQLVWWGIVPQVGVAALGWDVSGRSIPLTFRLFVSSHLKRIALNTRPSRFDAHIRWHQLTALIQIIPVLSTSLEHRSLLCGPEKDGSLRNATSSPVLRCGPLLRSFDTFVGGCHPPPHAASEFAPLDYRTRTPSNRSIAHASVPRGPPPRGTSSHTVGPSPCVTRKWHPSKRSHTRGRRECDTKIPPLPRKHYPRFNLLVFHHKIPGFGYVVRAD